MAPETMQMFLTFLSLALTGMGVFGLYLFTDIRGRLSRMEGKLDGKMDETDHDKTCARSIESVNQRLSDTWQRFDTRLSTQENKLCSHSHTGLDDTSKITWTFK